MYWPPAGRCRAHLALLASGHRFMLLRRAQSEEYTARFEAVAGL